MKRGVGVFLAVTLVPAWLGATTGTAQAGAGPCWIVSGEANVAIEYVENPFGTPGDLGVFHGTANVSVNHPECKMVLTAVFSTSESSGRCLPTGAGADPSCAGATGRFTQTPNDDTRIKVVATVQGVDKRQRQVNDTATCSMIVHFYPSSLGCALQ